MSQVRGMAISRLGRLAHSKSPIQWLNANAAARGMRRYSAAAANNGPLPLEGYRVLDMSRVLAGVS
jgi:succinate--hydroxymethylglutarate CoA-transferase